MTCLGSSDSLAGRKILITGGSGFIGSHLVERLLCERAAVAVLARTRGRLEGLIANQQYSFFPCDLRNSEKTRLTVVAFEPEIVFHLAAHPDSKENFEQAGAALSSNTLATLNILEAFRSCDGRLFIYGDSCKVYGDGDVPYRECLTMNPVSSYAIAKAAGWELCNLYRRVHGVATVSLRATMVHGPRQRYNLISYVMDCFLSNARAVILDGGSQTRDLLAVQDAVEAYVAVARQGGSLSGHVINIGGGCEKSVADVAQMVLKILGSNIPVVIAQKRTRPTEMQRSYCDNEDAARLLGWRPKLDLQTALEQTVVTFLRSRTRQGVAPLAATSAASQYRR